MQRSRRARHDARRAAVFALARVEARRLITHQAVIAAVALTGLWLLAQSSTYDNDFLSYKYVVGAGLLPFALSVMLASNLAASRSRRSATDELFETMPMQPHDRTVAHLMALVAPVLVAAGSQAVVVVALRPWNGLAPPRLGGGAAHPVTPGVAGWLQGTVLVGLGGVLGIALARWIPNFLAAGLAAVGGFVSWSGILWWNWGWQRFLLPLAHDLRTVSADDPGVGQPIVVQGSAPVGLTWHVGYLAGLAVLLAGLALLGEAPRRRATGLAVAGLAAATVAGVMQVAEWGT